MGIIADCQKSTTTNQQHQQPHTEIMKIFNFLIVLQMAFAQQRRTIASKRVNKYYDFVKPYLDIFIDPKSNGKMMEVKKNALDKKFKRYTNRFVKFYVLCGTDGQNRKRRDAEQEELEELAFIEEIQAGLDEITASKRLVRGKIGDLSAYDVTPENANLLWHKITAGFSRNFDRHIAPGTCNKKTTDRLTNRLSKAKSTVSRFTKSHRGW